MDLDAYVAAHAREWQRLEQLTRQRRLSGAEADELVERYQQVATHLSVVRTSAPDASLIAHLSSVLARARNRAAGARTGTWRGVGLFFTDRFPAALYRLRWWWLATLAGSVVVTAVMILWLRHHPNVEQSLLSPDQVDRLTLRLQPLPCEVAPHEVAPVALGHRVADDQHPRRAVLGRPG